MKTYLKFGFAIIISMFIFVVSCTKENNSDLMEKEALGIEQIDTPLFRAKDCQSDCCWDECGGTINGCDCSNFPNRLYALDINGIIPGENLQVLLTPAFSLGSCSNLTFSADISTTIALDTERYNLETEATTKEGVQWRVSVAGNGSQPVQTAPVSITLTRLDNDCRNGSRTMSFLLDRNSNTSVTQFDDFCLQCAYIETGGTPIDPEN